jgi:ABC-type glycerol-3-phosphate transport system permease component
MSVYTHPVPRAIPAVVRQLAWFALVCTVAFLVPFLGVTVLDLQHDLFYLVYFALTIALIAGYARAEQVAVGEILGGRRRWSLGAGAVLAVFLVLNVVRTEDATARPHGAYFVFELLWRGVGYGLVDTVLLTVLPCLVAYALLRGRVDGWRGKLRFTALALPLVVAVTAVYHLGYPQYRRDGLGRPETGNVLISIPTFATANPVGSVVAHVSQHVAAVTHAYESRIFNPPATRA